MNAQVVKNCIVIVIMTIASAIQVLAATITYTADNGIIANPERGYWYFNSNSFGGQSLPSPLSGMVSYLDGKRLEYGLTTIVPTYGLVDYRTTAQLPQNVLDLVDADFATARANGFKLIPRFSYCAPENPTDATPAIIAGHLQQLKPIFAKNTDVMALGGLGMYGYWGEQWGTSNCSDKPLTQATDNTKTIFAAMLDAVPLNRMFLMRYTRTMRQLLGDTPCPESEAFTGTPRSRVGHYNDCFMASGSAEFDADEGPWSYTSVQGSYTPDLAVDMSCASGYTDQLVIDNLDNQHFDFALIDNGTLSKACIMEQSRNLGYRYRLVSATIGDAVALGNTLNLSITMANDGYGGVYNPRAIEIILRNQSSGTKYVLNVIGDDAVRYNRLYLPKSHETKTLSISGGIPASMPSGSYDVLLNLPDPYPSIHDRPEYSIHLANANTWESTTGYNKLNHTLTVNASGSGTAYTGSSWFSLNGVATPSAPTITGPASLSNGSTGSAFSATFTASGSTPLTWSVISGTLPAGISLNAGTGVYSGTPTSTGTYAFTVKATNTLGNNTKSCSHTIRTVAPNLALNKQATASSLEGTGYEVASATDGNLSTRWASIGGVDSQWLSVDLGNTYSVDSIVLNWEASYAKTYKIQISGDGNSWTDAYTTTTGDGDVDNIHITPTACRFVRIYGTQRATQWGYSLWEIEVYGTPSTAANRISVIGAGRLKVVRSAINPTYDIRGRTVVNAKTAGRGVYLESLSSILSRRVAVR